MFFCISGGQATSLEVLLTSYACNENGSNDESKKNLKRLKREDLNARFFGGHF